MSETAFVTCDSENKIAVWKQFEELTGRLRRIAGGVQKWMRREGEGGKDGIINMSCCIDDEDEGKDDINMEVD